MMARYIDADALADKIVNTLKRRDYASDSHTYACFKTFIEILDEAPTANVVEVVRCGECTKWDAHEGDEYGTCANGEYISRNDYCSLGERKTDNEQV